MNMFLNKYGESHVEKYDILENEQFEIIVLEIGSVIPKQISGHLENLSKIYRGCDINALQWWLWLIVHYIISLYSILNIEQLNKKEVTEKQY